MNWKVLITALIFSNLLMADYVRVSEDTGSGFVVQDFVKVFDETASTAAALYSYHAGCNVSYSGTVFSPTYEATTLAVIETSEGTTLFVVHDRPSQGDPCPYSSPDSTGGTSYNTYDLSFDLDGMNCMVKDGDVVPENNDTYWGCGSDSVIADHLWHPAFTDGIVLGTLEGAWQLDMGYNADPTGVNSIIVLGSDEHNVTGLTPSSDTIIRLDYVLEVEIDVKPGSDPNCFNINGRGVIPVAVLGSAEFDVTSIALPTLKFGGLTVRIRGNNKPQCSFEDANEDGFTDLVCQFVDDAGAWTAGDTVAELRGELTDTTPFFGEDAICIRP